MTHAIQLADGREVDLDLFIRNRPYLWRRPVLDALGDLAALDGARVLEIGCGQGWMSTLFALQGATVTAVDISDNAVNVKRFASEWGCSDRVHFVRANGVPCELRDGSSDLVFTKSVLWCIDPLSPLLQAVSDALAPGGRVAFVENVRGGPLLRGLRRVIRGPRHRIHAQYRGIDPPQYDEFRRVFDELRIRSYFGLVLGITGRRAS